MTSLLPLPLLLLLLLLTSAVGQDNTTTPCPLDTAILRNLVSSSPRLTIDRSQACHHLRQGIRLLHSDYLRRTGNFLPPLSSAGSCWLSFQRLVDDYLPNFDVRSSCGFSASWISQGCVNITTVRDFETLVSNSSLADLDSACNQPLDNRSPCASCTTALSRLQALYFPRSQLHSIGNISDCQVYPWIYTAAAVVNPVGKGAVKCLFSLDFTSNNSNSRKRKIAILVASAASLALISILIVLIVGIRFRQRIKGKSKLGSGFGTISSRNTTLVKFKFDEIRKATKNFSRDNIIGLGGFGNVYRGQLIGGGGGGGEVAVKRFKNCSASGDESFAHEVEVISSVHHVNLVSLIGYSIATTPTEGHQRLIVCELVKNGSLHDHLFGSSRECLSWEVRYKVAIGTAQGLVYLHRGCQRRIIHRDIKAANILLTEEFEPQICDFGLAKWLPEKWTHHTVSKFEGTFGYLAPEFLMHGIVDEKTDVFAFGVLLLELVTGRRALDYKEQSLVLWAKPLLKKNDIRELVDPALGNDYDAKQANLMLLAAALCIQQSAIRRPQMPQVEQVLRGKVSCLKCPKRCRVPFFTKAFREELLKAEELEFQRGN
ncbi:unnamed protein product [Linum tenue]|uniref:non-specific serine/threonine protein kinase n=1 Tax=Linum tenue TaxID=586396 RepID=A0AAV0IEG8_9ROSI|nr:unnamed protein product [Linum tenue]